MRFLDICYLENVSINQLCTFLRFSKDRINTLKHLQQHLIIIKRKWGVFQIIRPHGFTLQGASTKKALGDHRLGITVEQYYFIKHNKPLNYVNLPLIIEKPSQSKPQHENFYPIELLLIHPNIVYNPNY